MMNRVAYGSFVIFAKIPADINEPYEYSVTAIKFVRRMKAVFDSLHERNGI